MSIYSVPGRVLTSEPPGGDAIKLGKMIVRGCFSYGSGSRLRVGEDLGVYSNKLLNDNKTDTQINQIACSGSHGGY